MMRPSLRLLALSAASALTAGLLTSPASPAHADRQIDVLSGAPQVGQCYDASRKVAYDASSLDQPTVSCTQTHTLWVTAVIEVPAEIPIDSENDAYDTFASTTCMKALKPVLGDNRLKYAMSAYGSFTFHATDAQQAEGARWLSCTTGVVGSAKTLVTSKATKPAKVTGKSLPTKLQLCGTARYDRVNCAAPHVYTATFATLVNARPGSAQSAADRTCPRRVSSSTWMWSSRVVGPKQFLLTCLSR